MLSVTWTESTSLRSPRHPDAPRKSFGFQQPKLAQICGGHSARHAGQSGMIDEQELRRPARACVVSGCVSYHHASHQTVEREVCNFGIFSILTMHTRQGRNGQ